jgi:putative membrane protein
MTEPNSSRSWPRKPAAFRLDDPKVVVSDADDSFAPDGVQIRPELAPDNLPVAIETLPPARNGFPWGVVFWASLSGLILLAMGLSATQLIESLYARNAELGYFGSALAAVAVLALAVITGREILGLSRLATIETLHARATAALISDERAESQNIVQELLGIAKDNPHLARGRRMVSDHVGDIIDGADLIRIAERELMSPLDQEARRLISQAAQRVSVVTAISPRAVFDIAFVLISSVRLVRQLARLYGGRPGALGMIKLFRHVLAHLALTGGMAASDSLVQQLLGHGIAAKLSTRLGEGVINGLLTARLGLAAIDVTRPLPFAALPRPALTDLVGELIRRDETK